MAEGSLEGYVEVMKLDELASSGRSRVTVQDRVLVLFHVEGRVYALDHFCYRKGTPAARTRQHLLPVQSHAPQGITPARMQGGLMQELAINFNHCVHF